jgi:parallel beta-helix repeat protein
MARAQRARELLRRCLTAMVPFLMAAWLMPSALPGVSVAEAVTRTGNLWTVTPGAAAEIQPAIDAARDNGGGSVRLPAGVYLLSQKVRVHSGVTVYGDGMDQTVLRWAPGATLDHMMSNASLTDGNSSFQVWNLTLDGQGIPSGRSDCCFGLRLNNVQNAFIVNVAADSHSKDGIYLGYNRSNGAINVRLSGCRANNNGRNGISLLHGTGNVIDHCTVNGNNRGERVAGIDVEPDQGLNASNNKLVSNTANGQNVGIQLFVPFNGYATMSNNAVCFNSTTGNSSAGIYNFRGDQNIFVDNQTSGNGTNFLVDDSSLIGSQYAGSCQLGALPPNPSTAPTQTPTPIPTFTPTPTPTPKPRPGCSPRPTVSVTSQRGAPGALTVAVTVTRSAAAPTNEIAQLQFGPAQNASVEIGGQVRAGGSFNQAIPAGTQVVTFTVRRLAAGQSTTVPFSVVDDCGPWQTFVGGGPSAF